MAKKGQIIISKFTFLSLGIKLLLFQDLQHNSLGLLMPTLALRTSQDFINKDDDKVVQKWLEYYIHKIHNDRWSTSQTKGHNQKFKLPIPGSKWSPGASSALIFN